MNYKQIEKKADQFRHDCGIQSIGISNIFDMCNGQFYLIRYPLGEHAVIGAAMIKNKDRIIFSNSSCILSREIFTVAHEIGHFLLEHINISNQIHQDIFIEDSKSQDIQEKEANYFASCLLMPRDKVEQFIHKELQFADDYEWSTLDIVTIMATFNVSFDTAINRLNRLKYLPKKQYDRLQSSKVDIKISNLLRISGNSPDLCFAQNVKKIPIAFFKWVKSNYEKGVIPRETLEKAVTYLGNASVEDFDIIRKKEEDAFDLDAFLLEDDE